ncbi:ABC transporter substrate-binding protein [Bradyrhizobium sp. NP1]|uniref:ABC transporter substrate-binding protein n=1 Tax=Bradyrhizobium sp. NP1 TaxID=3049772 RepID=UPI0025A59FE7|nr:ABC transporter substrate-binding protein [Bradyrhizobium sp. NP1]WJR77436.1 ABC transporter substrate-binding protein [Bradyrhizobium sp. NP1]
MIQIIRKLFLGMLASLAVLSGGFQARAADLVIGAIAPMSGGGTEWGIALKQGVELAIAEVNEAGGLKVGSETHTPKLVLYDDQYTAQGGTTAATRLINVDKAKFIIGPIGSASVLGALGVTSPDKALVVSNGFSDKILTPESKFNFRVNITTVEIAPAIVKWLRERVPDAKRVGIISPNDATGQFAIKVLTDAYPKQGFEVVFKETYERGVNDFIALITRMMKAGVDVFELDSNALAEAGLMVKQARQLGFKGTIIQTGGPSIEEVIRIAGPLSEGFLSFENFDPNAASMQDFVKKYRARFSTPITTYAPLFYNAAQLLFEAMRRAGSLDKSAVSDQLEKLGGYDTMYGPVRWAGKEAYGIDHQLLTAFYVVEIKGGKPDYVARLQP